MQCQSYHWNSLINSPSIEQYLRQDHACSVIILSIHAILFSKGSLKKKAIHVLCKCPEELQLSRVQPQKYSHIKNSKNMDIILVHLTTPVSEDNLYIPAKLLLHLCSVSCLWSKSLISCVTPPKIYTFVRYWAHLSQAIFQEFDIVWTFWFSKIDSHLTPLLIKIKCIMLWDFAISPERNQVLVNASRKSVYVHVSCIVGMSCIFMLCTCICVKLQWQCPKDLNLIWTWLNESHGDDEWYLNECTDCGVTLYWCERMIILAFSP